MMRYFVAIIIGAGSLLIALLLTSPLAPLEDQITSLKYRVRGEQKADSNIVLIYIDSEAIKDLQWPVRRSYYALMINALTELKVRAIGIDILFENPNDEYSEYDQLLAHVTAQAKNVVLSAYFEKLILGGWKLARVESKGGDDSSYNAFDYQQVSDVYRLGDGLHLPMPELLQGAAGVGHVNVEEDRTLSLFIGSDQLIIPSFGTEVLRVASGTKRENLRYDHETLALRNEGKLLEIYAPEGKVDLNFPGRITSFATYPFLEVLKSYDAVRAGGSGAVPVQNLKNKIILIGVIAEGIGKTWTTPVDARFPSLGLHAVFLDNALRSGFTRTAPGWMVFGFALLFGLCCAWFILQRGAKAAWPIPVVSFTLIVIISFVCFAVSSFIIPLVPFMVAGLVASTSSLFYKHRFLREQLQSAQSEKEKITMELRDREAKVAMLERELVSIESKQSEDRTNELLEDIRRYKSEIHSLNARKDDMEEAVVADTGSLSSMKNFEGIIYESGGPMRAVVDFVAKIAQSDASVLVLGES
ncbi:MAG: CHASE2 domain-containing protein, partial [bacterium]